MMESNFFAFGKTLFLLPLLIIAVYTACSSEKEDGTRSKMVLVEGGTFIMGDVFGEGEENEVPVHEVTLADFYISEYEVTVGEFKRFIRETGYKTSAEGPIDPVAQRRIMQQAGERKPTGKELLEFKRRYLEYGGAGYWDGEKREWIGYDTLINWKNPGFQQTDADPVMAVSPDDAMQYCNWLSETAGLPVAYDLERGLILDGNGKPTSDITEVKGYRLPSEAEWEYAAREGGREVRFGNGKNVARSTEINFRGDEGEYSYLEPGGYQKKSTAVGSYPPNSLGLYDMSGNAWEWTGDKYAKYTIEARENPYAIEGDGHALRGGRWGGDAYEARVFHRSSWVRNDRCNNSGFRVARSK